MMTSPTPADGDLMANVRAILSLILRGFGGALMVPGWVMQRLADRIDRT